MLRADLRVLDERIELAPANQADTATGLISRQSPLFNPREEGAVVDA